MIEGRTAKIKIGTKEIGIIGEIHPKILKYYELDFPVSLLELDVNIIEKIVQEQVSKM